MNDFYLTLPSNNSMGYYPENTLAQFTSRLPNVINLSGDWEVGLGEIQYPPITGLMYLPQKYIALLRYGFLPPMTQMETLPDVPSLSEQAIIPISMIC